MSLALCQLQYATLSLLHYATCIMSLTLCPLHYASYIMHLTLCLQHYASCIMPLALCLLYYANCIMLIALCLLHYASCNKELIGSKEQSPTLKSLDPQYPRKQIIISRNLRRTRKRKFPEKLKNVKCFIFESGKSSLCKDSQDSHPVSESTPTFSSAMGFDSTFTSSARIQDSHPVKESVKYSRQPWESGRFPSPMGIQFQFTGRM